MNRWEMGLRAKALWGQRNDLIDQRMAHGKQFGMDEAYQKMRLEIDRLGEMAESYEHGIVPLVDAECTCGPDPDGPACPACKARAELAPMPFEPPNDPRIFNRRQPDGTYRPLSHFFEGAENWPLDSRD
jgi:hypothetical protein